MFCRVARKRFCAKFVRDSFVRYPWRRRELTRPWRRPLQSHSVSSTLQLCASFYDENATMQACSKRRVLFMHCLSSSAGRTGIRSTRRNHARPRPRAPCAGVSTATYILHSSQPTQFAETRQKLPAPTFQYSNSWQCCSYSRQGGSRHLDRANQQRPKVQWCYSCLASF